MECINKMSLGARLAFKMPLVRLFSYPNYLLFFSVLCLAFFVGCASNKYEEVYSAVYDGEYVHSDDDPKLIELASEKQLRELLRSDDYVLIGTSSLYDLWVPRTFAIKCGKKHGASLVALSYEVGKTVSNTAVVNVPTRQTTYHSGSIYGYGYGYSGFANYYGSSTTYGSTPMVINYEDTYYQQDAFFFAKRKYKNDFGVYFRLPENIPGNKDKTVRISLVVKGSKADKLGIKENDKVKSINGVTINDPEDVLPYIEGKEQIKTMKVTREKK